MQAIMTQAEKQQATSNKAVYEYVNMSMYMYICEYANICICVYTYVCMCVYVYMLLVCVYMYMYMCVYVYTLQQQWKSPLLCRDAWIPESDHQNVDLDLDPLCGSEMSGGRSSPCPCQPSLSVLSVLLILLIPSAATTRHLIDIPHSP